MKKLFHQILPAATTVILALSPIQTNAQEIIFPYIDEQHIGVMDVCVQCDARSQTGIHIEQATSVDRTLLYLLDMVEKQKDINSLLLQRIGELEQAIKEKSETDE